MAYSELCCASLEEPKTLMKMGLSVVLIGHINFLLGAMLLGLVLQHINRHKSVWTMDYTIFNMFALSSGVVGVVVGILAIVLSKNKKSKCLTWSLFTISLLSALMATASAAGLFVSVVTHLSHGGQSLLTHCRFPDDIVYSSETSECSFDPSRIYNTTLVLWIPLIMTCIIQLFFSARCSAVCVSFLGLPRCPTRKTPRDDGRAIDAVRSVEEAAPLRITEPPTHHTEPLPISRTPPRGITAPHRQQRQITPPLQHLPHLHHSLPRSERQHLPRLHHSPPPSERQHLPHLHHSPPRSERQHLPRLHHSPPRSERQHLPRLHHSPPRSERQHLPRLHHSPPRSERQHLPRLHHGPPRSERQHLPRLHQSLPPSKRQHLPRLHQSLPPLERQPRRQSYRQRSDGSDSRASSHERAPAQNRRLPKLERYNFWI